MSFEEIMKEIELAIIPDSTIAVSSNYRNYAEYQAYLKEMGSLLNKMGLPLSIENFARVIGDFEDNYVETLGILAAIQELSMIEPVYALLLAIPKTFKDKVGCEYFAGDLSVSNIDALLPLNAYFDKTLSFPEEFILGYITASPATKGKLTFKHNEKYIGSKSEEEQIEFFESIKESLIDCGIESIDGFGSNVIFFKRDLYHLQLEKYLELREQKIKK